MSSPKSPVEPTYADRVYRSLGGIIGGTLLLGLIGWLAIDAIVRGAGRTPWFAVAAVLLVVPLVVALSIRPAVMVSDDRVLIRNPFRTVHLPWGAIEDFRAGYSSEVWTKAGDKFQLWAVPVSLRQRNRAARRREREERAKAGRANTVGTQLPDHGTQLAPADQTISDLRGLIEHNAGRASAQGEPRTRWAFELIVPAAVGAVLMIVLFVVG
ncbi:PH domain-containing protein [Streptomyces sp. NPDC005963]|uniref:PH domain-containing protein n=1 Tax=Streptomyces sp. NPDC005963 TaxID=3156721 RepID=UPI0033C04FDC